MQTIVIVMRVGTKELCVTMRKNISPRLSVLGVDLISLFLLLTNTFIIITVIYYTFSATVHHPIIVRMTIPPPQIITLAVSIDKIFPK